MWSVEDIEVSAVELDFSFWLDLPGSPGWKSFGRIDTQACFLIDGGLALIRIGGVTNGCSCTAS
jgi:hypothetical protein